MLCKNCGRQLTRKDLAFDQIYYHCYKDTCSELSITETKLEKEIYQLLQNLHLSEETFHELQSDYAYQIIFKDSGSEVLLRSLKRNAQAIKKKLKELINLRTSNNISLQEYIATRKEYLGRIEDVQSQIISQENKQKQNTFEFFKAHYFNNFSSLLNAEKQEILKVFLPELILENKGILVKKKSHNWLPFEVD